MNQLSTIPGLTVEERLIAGIIGTHRGQSNAVQARHIGYRVGLPERKVREIIKELVERHHLPIGSTPANPGGYYIITDPRELRQVRRSLVRRAVSILNRAKAYDRAGWVAEMAGQLSLKLESSEKEPDQGSLWEGDQGDR